MSSIFSRPPSPSGTNSPRSTPHDANGLSHNTLGFLLTFLGVFIALVSVGIGGRRAYERRRQHDAMAAAVAGLTKRTIPQQKPRMWDVWLDKANNVRKWENVMPVSAWVDPLPPQPSPPPPAPVPYGVEHHIMMSQAWFRGVQTLEQPYPSSTASARASGPPAVHVAVLIAMPSQARSLRVNGTTNGNDEERARVGMGSKNEVGECENEKVMGGVLGEDGGYVFGMADAPWEPGGEIASTQEPERGSA